MPQQMSSFLCNHVHVGRLAQFAECHKAAPGQTCGEIAIHLARANLDGVGCRYGQTHDETAKHNGYESDAAYVAECIVEACRGWTVNPPQAFGMARCSGYQSCDVPGPWDMSDGTYRLLRQIEIAACLQTPRWPFSEVATEDMTDADRRGCLEGLVSEAEIIWELHPDAPCHVEGYDPEPATPAENPPAARPQDAGRRSIEEPGRPNPLQMTGERTQTDLF